MKKLLLLLIMSFVLASCSDPSSSGRCKAITKDGTQCKRTAEKGGSYCWQH